jgi:hypothetical protein
MTAHGAISAVLSCPENIRRLVELGMGVSVGGGEPRRIIFKSDQY